MLYLLQMEDGKMDEDVQIVKNQLETKGNQYVHSTFNCNLSMMNSSQSLRDSICQDGIMLRNGRKIPKYIPIGSIEFVQSYLNLLGVDTMNPIEVPKCLQKPCFLNRDYRIVEARNIPKKGNIFMKRADKLKEFSGCIDFSQENHPMKEVEDGLWQVSEIMDILSEWRIFVHNGRIINCVPYFSKNELQSVYFPDRELLNRMLAEIALARNIHHAKLPFSYTLDVAVTSEGTSLLEMHPWVSIGLYGYLFGNDLLYAYQNGIDYYLNDNVPVEPCHIRRVIEKEFERRVF